MAAFSPSYSAEILQALPEFKDASHRMAAWRTPSKQRSLSSHSIFETGYDDDGENHGGKTLEKILIAKNVTGTIVVGRWYGGVMLGPVRFDHIRDCAGDAMTKSARDGERAAKKAKLEVDRQRLIDILPERDQSIFVLRGLLAEKKHGVSPSQDSAKTSPSKAPGYTTMELSMLERLEIVRDKTIGWILAQIEEAEQAQEKALNMHHSGIGEVDQDQKGLPSSEGLTSEQLGEQKREDAIFKVLVEDTNVLDGGISDGDACDQIMQPVESTNSFVENSSEKAAIE